MTQRTVVVGVGAADRGDDIAGWAVADRLGSRTEVHYSSGDPFDLTCDWTGADLAVVVDAMRSGRPAGSVEVLDAHRLPSTRAASSHGLGIAEAVSLSRAVGSLPRRLVVVGIEGRRFGVGDAMSPEVRAAIRPASELVAHLCAVEER